MSIHFLFPRHPFEPNRPDELFELQFQSLTEAGFTASTFGDPVIREGRPLRGVPEGSTVVLRGWMMTAAEYSALTEAIEATGAKPLVDPATYLLSHHLPNWYPLIHELTPETRFFETNAPDLADQLTALGWDGWFVKDHVKSLKTSVGSIVRDPSTINLVIAEMREFRGEIEGGLCVRRLEDFRVETEWRFFVLFGEPFGSDSNTPVPTIVMDCAERIPSPFFSVDVIERTDGVLRVVEIGDGQVSDLVGWDTGRFAEIWALARPTGDASIAPGGTAQAGP